MSRIGFGDTVRIKVTPETERIGVAGVVGTVYGETVPSSSGASPIIGTDGRDYAINVHFDDLDASHWFIEDLIEFVDHGAGFAFEIKGVPRRWTKSETGEWIESDTEANE